MPLDLSPHDWFRGIAWTGNTDTRAGCGFPRGWCHVYADELVRLANEILAQAEDIERSADGEPER